MADHAAKEIRPMPRRRECRNAAATVTTNSTRTRIFGNHQIVLLRHHRPQLVDDEVRVIRAHRVVLKRPIAPRLIARLRTRHTARIHKQPDRYRQLLLVNEIIKHNRHARVSVLAHKPAAVLKHHQICRQLRIILRRDVHPVRPCRTGKRLAVVPCTLNHLAARHAVPPLRIRPRSIIRGPQKAAGKEKKKNRSHEQSVSRLSVTIGVNQDWIVPIRSPTFAYSSRCWADCSSKSSASCTRPGSKSVSVAEPPKAK